MSLDSLRVRLADRYTVERELGRGGTAPSTWPTDLSHGRPVALKVLRPELTPAGRRALPARNQIDRGPTAAPAHPGAARFGRSAGTLSYVMPYVEGESLRAA